ncbi:MAG TPA: hypothetical protein DGH68_13035 [Bacteroidetes bacterium]|nr:hypothetical protein [Bacteroidota bacterium]
MFVVHSCLGPNTSWLVGTDALLGVFTLLLLAAAIVAIVVGLIGRLRGRKRDLIQGSHATTLRQLGIAMTDDDEQPDEKDLHPGRIPTKKVKSTTHAR